jgi:hypothetical protein
MINYAKSVLRLPTFSNPHLVDCGFCPHAPQDHYGELACSQRRIYIMIGITIR